MFPAETCEPRERLLAGGLVYASAARTAGNFTPASTLYAPPPDLWHRLKEVVE